MQAVKLSLKQANKIPIEADTVTPDNFAGKTKEEIEAILVWYGNGQCPLGDFFTVEVEGSDSAENTKIVFEGDVFRVKRIGQGMSAGEIEINGNVDMHCGFGMKGGKIVINGDADSWLGCEMKGGEIILNGNATYYVGSGYRGEACGMRGGKITINGNARDYLGEHMCGGEILVTGNVGLLPAVSNNGGTIVIEGNATMPASEMKNGTVIIKGEISDMLPSYKEDGTEEVEGITYRKFVGDVNAGGKGMLLVK
ncbi:formylmethanofuran dehydrogenase subunit C [Methanosarcina sp. Mfa9]|uniref:formylmethanofuran dehydrogenase subunit C n=1 Tax=Methanosarcina sp. Mfa9 TaxID=3439063 RepID=UPI003F839718